MRERTRRADPRRRADAAPRDAHAHAQAGVQAGVHADRSAAGRSAPHRGECRHPLGAGTGDGRTGADQDRGARDRYGHRGRRTRRHRRHGPAEEPRDRGLVQVRACPGECGGRDGDRGPRRLARVRHRPVLPARQRCTAGTEIVLSLADGGERRYRVASVDLVLKPDVPWPAIFDRTGPARLTLVTCGGEFDYTARRYLSNVIVSATPVP
ncbi:class F sortase [Cryobacterium sp. 10C3]|uniref:class F sortase n=1 Tax=Cryobacterium sp. 10C3 TaxID=3048577 RepID=UPI003A0FE29D